MRRWSRRVRVLVVCWVLVCVLVLGEALARLRVKLSPPYYAVTEVRHGVLHYPFGDIAVGHHGYPDSFPRRQDRRPRVAYLGDSVTFGIGVGGNARFTEVLDRLVPGTHHINLGVPGWPGPELEELPELAKLVRKLRARRVVYVLNLNDIVPLAGSQAGADVRMVEGRGSYLLTHLLSLGFAARDRLWPELRPMAVELAPSANGEAIAGLASRVHALQDSLRPERAELTVVMLPYEMQISSDAATRLAALGVRWEDGFLEGSTQDALASALGEVEVHDARAAFPADRSVLAGECFVHDAGGRLDFDHLTRDGHARVGTWMAEVLFDAGP